MVFLISNFRRTRSASPGSARSSSRISIRPRASSGSAAAKRSSASAASVSITVPDASTSFIARTVEYESQVTPQRIPPELLAITAPTVAMSLLAGSGPSAYPCSRSTRFATPTSVPGLTRARRPPSSTSTPYQWRRTSTRMPSVCPWPFRLVPPPRKVMCMPCSRA